MAKAIVRRARLISNIAYYELLQAEPFQLGESVTVTGCTTSTFNVTGAVLKAGLLAIPPASSSNAVENWPGIAIAVTNADIPQEREPVTAIVTSTFGTSTSSPTNNNAGGGNNMID